MNWDQQYGFGHQSPPLGQTPTTSHFPETPKYTANLENRSGWTPTYAEEYTVFASTPGRLTGGTERRFAETSTPQQPYSILQDRRFSSDGDIEAELASHVHILSDQGASLLPVTNSKQLPSSPNPDAGTTGEFEPLTNRKITPRPKKGLDELFSAQTATPPNTASKGSRKQESKVYNGKKQSTSLKTHLAVSRTPTQNSVMSFTPTSSDMFDYPMSAPATAPVFTSTKLFWDPDSTMHGMGLDFTSTMTEDAGLFDESSHRISSTLDWGRNNQIFQDAVKFPPSQKNDLVIKRPRPLAPKNKSDTVQAPSAPFTFSSSGVAADPFVAPVNVLDPGLLYTSHNSMSSSIGNFTLPGPRSSAGQAEREPYQHQLRESRRDQEELRRLRGSGERKRGLYDRRIVSSPVRGATVNRSLSESRARKPQDRSIINGRSSPIKNQGIPCLTSIPESHALAAATEVKLTVDAKGKARMETVIVRQAQKRAGPSSIANSDEMASSPNKSSSDEEEIILPSRNTSFAMPSQLKAPKLNQSDTANRRTEVRRQSTGGSGHSHSESSNSTRVDGAESEAETLVGQDDHFGDATHELRKIMESRIRGRKKAQEGNHHYLADKRGTYFNDYNSLTNISPGTVTDLDEVTPTSSRSGGTRCVCDNLGGGGSMIQCESCDYWLHKQCVGIDRRNLLQLYICAFCAQTPRRARAREATGGTSRIISSPLAHKSFKSFR